MLLCARCVGLGWQYSRAGRLRLTGEVHARYTQSPTPTICLHTSAARAPRTRTPRSVKGREWFARTGRCGARAGDTSTVYAHVRHGMQNVPVLRKRVGKGGRSSCSARSGKVRTKDPALPLQRPWCIPAGRACVLVHLPLLIYFSYRTALSTFHKLVGEQPTHCVERVEWPPRQQCPAAVPGSVVHEGPQPTCSAFGGNSAVSREKTASKVSRCTVKPSAT